ncbi:NADP oxidoreductase [Micromonospora qiuiae]|uniref:NADP oxidoreductase n=1 Tax=Micromonospora qiuiae TaxID=502268 RepID=A0ABQ4JGD2_9ACTN|nr:NAD(P)-binding domain-containing protein [Micromonospora qiuiae]GIJ29599.1 NADP oxidoreductase [Micromonospora qiuiae]
MTTTGPIRTIGIFGAGKSGIAIARQALAAGYNVRITTSGPAERTALVAAILTPGAIAVDGQHLADGTDLVVLAVPLRAWRELPLALLAGRIVVDVMNYWPPADGILPEFETGRPSSEIVRDGLPPDARLVKTVNHIGYHEIEELARPAGSPDRVALAVAGDDTGAVALVSQFIDDLGFDAVAVGGLAASAVLQPGSAIFGANLGRDDMLAAIETAGQRS